MAPPGEPPIDPPLPAVLSGELPVEPPMAPPVDPPMAPPAEPPVAPPMTSPPALPVALPRSFSTRTPDEMVPPVCAALSDAAAPVSARARPNAPVIVVRRVICRSSLRMAAPGPWSPWR